MMKYPFFCFNPKVNEGEPFFRSDFITDRQFRDLDIFEECFRLLGMTHHAAVYVPTGDGRLMWFGLERANGGGFTERDRVMLSLGRQHLANARQLAYARQRLGDEAKLDPAIFGPAGFTPRECEVIYWLLEGKSNVEIAVLLNVQTQTIKGHMSALFNKTGVGNRLALTLHMLELARSLRSNEPAMHEVPARMAENGGPPPKVG
jgi:DNA-binding CsgD family transcriptional regulator